MRETQFINLQRGTWAILPKWRQFPFTGTKMALSGYRKCGPLQCCCQCLWWLGKQLALVHRRTEESLEHQHHLWPLGEKMGLRTNSDLSPRLMCVEIVFLICLKINIYIYRHVYSALYWSKQLHIWNASVLSRTEIVHRRSSSSRIWHHFLRSTGAMAPILATLRGASPRITGRVAWHTAG